MLLGATVVVNDPCVVQNCRNFTEGSVDDAVCLRTCFPLHTSLLVSTLCLCLSLRVFTICPAMINSIRTAQFLNKFLSLSLSLSLSHGLTPIIRNFSVSWSTLFKCIPSCPSLVNSGFFKKFRKFNN
jgi:hypothetical protein